MSAAARLHFIDDVADMLLGCVQVTSGYSFLISLVADTPSTVEIFVSVNTTWTGCKRTLASLIN
jgi:hypothetical protein